MATKRNPLIEQYRNLEKFCENNGQRNHLQSITRREKKLWINKSY